MVGTEPLLVRVVVVDDSPTVRATLVQILGEAPGTQVVGTGAHGEEAVRLVARLKPDVVTMDVRMPRMDGLEATRRIMRETPTPIVIVTDEPTDPKIDLTFEALRAGALTVVRKPSLGEPAACAQLADTVRLMARVPVIHHWGRHEHASRVGGAAKRLTSGMPAPSLAIQPRPGIRIIGVGASTGGPAALAVALGLLPREYPIPVLVVQHITHGFARGLVEWLGTKTSLAVRLATHGEQPRPGAALVAPDDHHLQVDQRGMVELAQTPPYKGLRPSANALFRSMARVYGAQALGVILTGMGDDGADGLEELHARGGMVLAQDQATSVVYGMPYAAATRRIVDGILPLEGIAGFLASLPGVSVGGR